MQKIPALPSPYGSYKPRMKRETLTFNEALENLKRAKGDSSRCAASPTVGQCSKTIPLDRSRLSTLVTERGPNSIESIVGLMNLMLCPTHWPMSDFYGGLVFDAIKTLGVKLDPHFYESMVVDLESAAETPSPLKESVLSNDNAKDYPTALLITTDKNKQTDLEAHDLIISEDKQRLEGNPGNFVLVNPHSYASLELGVAKIEIMYQESLKCIAMAADGPSTGWRCEEMIKIERLREAQRILPFLDHWEDELLKKKLKELAMLVLCEGHCGTNLPQYYAQSWSEFASKRLPKEEALARSDLELWKSSTQRESGKTSSTSFPRQGESERTDSTPWNCTKTEFDFATPRQKLPRAEGTDSSRSPFLFARDTTDSSPSRSSQSIDPHGLQSAQSDSIMTTHNLFSTPSPSNTLTPAIDSTSRSAESDGGASDSHKDVDANFANGRSTFHQSSPSPLSRAIKVEPPSISTSASKTPMRDHPFISEDVTNLSNSFGQTSISGKSSVSPYDKYSCLYAAHDGAVSDRNTTSSSTVRPPQRPIPLTIPRDPVRIKTQGTIDGDLASEMRASIRRGGYVYIFKSSARNLVKIGKARDVERRKFQIRNGCQLPDLDEVESASYHLRDPERVERLVHLELQNFRVYVVCQHLQGSNGSSAETEQEHREWFNVPEDVAVESVQLWREFVSRAYTPDGTIREYWARRINEIPPSSREERMALKRGMDGTGKYSLDEHHRFRQDRYREWMNESE